MSITMQPSELQLTTAYSVCRHIARSSAKNFYYGFMLLPARKRNALSAVFQRARQALKTLDKEVQQRLLDVVKPTRITFYTQGHGERTVDPAGDAVDGSLNLRGERDGRIAAAFELRRFRLVCRVHRQRLRSALRWL